MALSPTEAAKISGCGLIDMPYKEQLAKKDAEFRKLLAPFRPRFEPIIAMEDPYHYRCKVNMAFGEDKKHNPLCGTFEEKSHRLVPMESCLIDDTKADAIIVSIRDLLKSFKIRPYNEDSGFGLLRYVLVRVGRFSGEIMVILVTADPIFPSKKNFIQALLKIHPEITTVVQNVNDRRTGMVLGDKQSVLYGKGYIVDALCGKTFKISPKSFYQVNPLQAQRLYEKAMAYADLSGTETVIDAYCGTGTIGLVAADKAKEVIGVELNGDAIKDAKENARHNGVKNITFYQNDAGKFLVQMAEQGAKADVVLLDPPRSGSTEEFLAAVIKIAPKKIVYVSCNPQTLARDLEILRKAGYQARQAVAVDMFPHTESLEGVVSLRRR